MTSKQAYEQQLRKQLDDWNVQISALKEKADHAPDPDTRAEYNGHIEEIHALQQTAENKLEELECCEETAWEHLKEDIEIAWEKVETAVKNLASKF